MPEMNQQGEYMTPETDMQDNDQIPGDDAPILAEEDAPEHGKKKRGKALRILLVVGLMAISFLVGWRFMAYKWWPALSPYVKQAAYSMIPSLKPQATAVPAAEPEYCPRSDARVGDPISAGDSVFYYFYYPTCPYCANYGNMLLAGLPEYITLPDGQRSRVVMISLNKHDDQEVVHIDGYYTAHGIVKNDEQNDQVVPSIVIGDAYLRGTPGIRDNFYKLLLDGAGLTTPLIDGAARAE